MEGQGEAGPGEFPHPYDVRGSYHTQSTDVGTELKEVQCQQVAELGLRSFPTTKATLHFLANSCTC